MKQIIPFAHSLLAASVQEGETVVDATLGNGHDSLYLSKLVGRTGKVIGVDIQSEALEHAEELFSEHLVTNVTTQLIGHEKIGKVLLEESVGSIGGAIFNLGYLPGGDHSVTTKAETTIKAVDSLLAVLQQGRLIVMVLYPGHEDGKRETENLLSYLQAIPSKQADIFQYSMVNRSERAPFVVAIEKK
ncbi:class I SAM-dependent methyltransferase [Halalkalibacillus halophilus]|uniref:class I SAM-dependent methyltransferase n=1 Tax=Halalkalibacillus halophilus TaxID=392827 RepID=UPI0003F53307|nr:class I SAM-dependent methyltransferase [Halalkalibacillus halophilus]